MKKLFCLALMGILVMGYCFAIPKSHKCPICDMSMNWTGKTKVEHYKDIYEMKCPMGHSFWETNNQNSSSSSNDIKCQYDDTIMRWTGKTKVENYRTFKEYKCLEGHIEWRRYF